MSTPIQKNSLRRITGEDTNLGRYGIVVSELVLEYQAFAAPSIVETCGPRNRGSCRRYYGLPLWPLPLRPGFCAPLFAYAHLLFGLLAKPQR